MRTEKGRGSGIELFIRGERSLLDLAVLLRRCREGDALAWEALVRRFQSRVYGLAFFYVRDPEEARDLAQEIFVRIYRGIHDCNDDHSFVSWMLATGRHCCIDRLRALKRRPSTHPITLDQGEEPSDSQPNPEQFLESDARRKLIYQGLNRLTRQNREIIMLKDIQGLKLKEIAEILDLSIGTVKSRSVRARIDLAKAIIELDPGFGSRL